MALLDGRRPTRPKALFRGIVRRTVTKFSPVQTWNPAIVKLCGIAPALWMVLLALGAVSSFATPAEQAQTSVNDVHAVAREVEKAKTEEVANKSLSEPKLDAHTRPLKVSADLVLVPVTITDPMNRLVTGLDKENFQLFEGSAKEEIKTFSSEDAPVSLGVIFDSSGSMSSKMDRAKDAVEFFKTANPQDEFFMITFSDAPGGGERFHQFGG